MPRKNKIIIRTGSSAPTASDFVTGEPAWDSSNSKLYVKSAAGTMVDITGSGGGGGGAPAAHASTHASGGTDAVSLAASQITSGTFDPARLPLYVLHPFLLMGG